MVDALRGAASMASADGVIVDIHPTAEPAHLEILEGGTLTRIADRIDDGGADGPRRRHASADLAIARCIADGLVQRVAAAEFSFWTEADTTAELRAYVSAKWKQLHFDDDDFRRADAALSGAASRTVVVTESVIASTLTRGVQFV
jgi:hypothetical protein